MPTNVRTARALATAQRRAQVVELRRNRMSFAEIAAELGMTESGAWRAYQKALASVPSPAVAQHRKEELELLDAGINDLLKLARDHSRPRYAVEAWNCIVRISERRAKLLGLDAPLKKSIEVIEADTVEREIKRLEQELLAMGATPEELGLNGGAKVSRVLREPGRAELHGNC